MWGKVMDATEMSSATWARRITRVVGAIAVTAGTTVVGVAAPLSSAQPCPDVEAVFARGTSEPPGVGGIGQSFVDDLRAQVGSRSLEVYPVNYAASSDFGGGIEFAKTVVDGIRDAGDHISATAANCPNTRIVLGGFSQGAALAGYVTERDVPVEVPAEYRSYLPKPLPPEVAGHVAAVTLFGTPSAAFLQGAGAPPVTIGPAFADRTIQMCAPADTICSGDPNGGPPIGHTTYGANGMTEQAAEFAVSHL